jgi:hypothetical protein
LAAAGDRLADPHDGTKGCIIVTTSRLYAEHGWTAETPGRPVRVPWWRMPFSVDTWRQMLCILLALPASLVAQPAPPFNASGSSIGATPT